METKIIDLSKPIQYNAGDPWFMKVKIKHKSHKKSHWLIRLALGLPAKLFPKNWKGWADDRIISMGLHSTTHIDAPWHYGPVVEGKPAKTIDQIPLEWCYGPGIVIDCSHKEDFVAITIADLKADLEKNNISIKPGTIVLIRTGRDKLMGTPDFPNKGTGMSREATEWLIDQGVKVMGIDQWGWDLPLKFMAKRAKELNNPDYFWEAHRMGIDKEYLHIEQLTNLSALPPSGFEISVFPLKIVGGSAAPARVVAILK